MIDPSTLLGASPSTSLRATRLAVLLVAAATLRGSAQSQPATPSFEVASIKRNVSSEPGGFIRVEEGVRFNATGVPLSFIIRQAYGVLETQVANQPDWFNSERYDIRGKAPDGVEVFPNMAPLLRSLLQDRFGLQTHTEQRDLPTYDLVMARSDGRLGPKISKADFDCGARLTATPPKAGPSGDPVCTITFGPGRILVRGFSIGRFAGGLVSQVRRTVVDKTGLTGPWNFELLYTPDQPVSLNGAIVPPNPDAPSLFTAVQEQLGLKLESSRGPVDVLVIDRVNRPTED
jgi:bla regulator protein blaR1